VKATGTGIKTGISGNPIITTEAGKYGNSDPLAPHLVVQGDIATDTVITFYLKRATDSQPIQTAQTYTVQELGDTAKFEPICDYPATHDDSG